MVEQRSLRAEQVAATRAAILASARRLFGQRGYAATSIDDIAAAARVTKGAVYHHFGTKEELFRAVYAAVEADAQRRGSAGLPVPGGPLEQIIAGVNGYLDVTLDPEVQRVTLIDGPAVLGPEPEGPAEEVPAYQGLRDFVAAAIDQGAIAPVDPDALAHLIGGACLHAGMLIARSKDPAAARSRFGRTLEVLLRGLDRADRGDDGPAPPPAGR